MFFWVFPRRQYVICRRFGTMYQFHLQRLEVDSLLPAFEDGTDTWFRNVGILHIDAGEIPKRTYTIPLLLSDFNENCHLSTDLWKTSKHQISWKSVQWEPNCSLQTDARAWRNWRFSQFLQTHLKRTPGMMDCTPFGVKSARHNFYRRLQENTVIKKDDIIKMKRNRSLNTTNGLLAKMESSYVTTCFGLFGGHHQVTI